MRLYDAPACPFCARARLVLDEKGITVETVEIDLRNRSAELYALNPCGKVPVLLAEGAEVAGLEAGEVFVLPESPVIMEYLEELHPGSPLLPRDPAGRARARLAVHRFDELLGDDYYAFRKGAANELERRLEELPVGESLYVDLAFVPWVLRAAILHGAPLPPRIEAWLTTLCERPSVARERSVVEGLAR